MSDNTNFQKYFVVLDTECNCIYFLSVIIIRERVSPSVLYNREYLVPNLNGY